MDTAELLALAVEVLRANPYGFLVTVGEDGEPHARLVQPLHVGDGAEIAVGTSPRSRKVADVRRNPLVAYAVEDRAEFAYVTVSADAVVVDDEAVRRARWVEGLEPFFPAGPGGGDFVVLELRPARVEVMHFARGVTPDPYGLVPAIIRCDGGVWSVARPERSA